MARSSKKGEDIRASPYSVEVTDNGAVPTFEETNQSPADTKDKLSSTNDDKRHHHGDGEEEPVAARDGFFARRAKVMARNPWMHLLGAFIIAMVISVVGFIAGNFSIAADNAGWQSRGTLIANRQTQTLLTLTNGDRLFYEGNAVWDDLINNVQPGWEGGNDDDDDDDVDTSNERKALVLAEERRDNESGESFFLFEKKKTTKQQEEEKGQKQGSKRRELPFHLSELMKRRLQQAALGDGLQGCDVAWYSSEELTQPTNLWPVWETKGSTISALEAQVIRDICVAEQNTNAVLEANGLCNTCADGGCMPPYSLVFFARLTVGDTDFGMTCDELANAWSTFMASSDSVLQACVSEIKAAGNFDAAAPPNTCPNAFLPTLVDEAFGPNNNVIRYTSSIFATIDDIDRLYDEATKYDQASESSVVRGAYDTEREDFVGRFAGAALGSDMILAMGSALITTLAILIHTKSCWLTFVGLVQIILSFPLAYFVYTFIARLDFFPFLNFIGVFVVFALGADDVFVAVDKWKNARLENKHGSVEDIAAKAFPDAAGAMFLTTLTTAVAFFATAICPVAPLMCFAVFNGLLIMFDYLMCVLLVFPALCLYDKWKFGGCCLSCCVSCCNGNRRGGGKHGDDEDDYDDKNKEGVEKPSLIRRILHGYYDFLHFVRWPLLLLCVGALAASAVFAATLDLPTSSDVRLLNGRRVQYERNYEWRQQLLSSVLEKSDGSDAIVIWGVEAADTGDRTNPDTWSQLVLDESFDPSPEGSQQYLLGFCDNFFAQDFASLAQEDYVCPINAFDLWLQQEAVSATPSNAYSSNCNGANGLPMPQESFNQCIVAWSYLVDETSVLSLDGVIEIMYVRFQSRVRFDSPYNDLDREWKVIEDYLDNQRNNVAPPGVNNMYHSSDDFWWYDTNGRMLQTAFSAAGIALGAAGIVVLFSSRSLVLTMFALFTIAYVLASTTAMLVASGWTLGFLESVCFAILIGISCDFVIHFGHAYATLEGEVNRHERTKFALISMGPSILAAALTTVCSAVIMLFTVITFFQKFAIILFYTVIQATLGSFVVYLTLSDTIGPNHPTYTIDLLVRKCRVMVGGGKRSNKLNSDETMEKSGNISRTANIRDDGNEDV